MNDYAIINSGSKQYKVSIGDTIKTEKLSIEKGGEVIFSASMTKKDDEVIIGNPIIENINVKGIVIKEEGKAKKVIAFKMKRRKGERKKIGHRQRFSEIKITEIS
ncbi:MAG: 50S ribosomal protein L21 [Candidatus Acididesulfobacter diazotrophicus]|jgi:large subunit ribosomal protein L21|uniref:Large ribosomal subunit protein bL21 n=1 Tax=Candidatus Acididesulfobacter diazotrophicus TaxID=2597226 RepID=A0A519BMK2_9DELT|nr:MAG: 50S ribosomal protein L21 [Candidatus Acididesulfobacter diazotrophicus]